MPRIPDRILVLLTVWLLAMGAVMLVAAGGFWLVERQAVRGDAWAQGTITEEVPGDDAAGKIVYFPRIRFRTPDGAILQFIATNAPDDEATGVGDTVPVVYPAGRPQAARLGTKMKIFPVACVLGLIGIILFDLGGIGWIMLWRRRRPKKIQPSRARNRRAYGR